VPAQSYAGQVTGAKVLVVEDDLDLRGVLLRGLREEGFDAVGAGSGGELLDRIEPEAPDLLIVDIGLPDADGRDVVQALRAQGASLPILFLTARDALTDRVTGFSAGGDDYLTKPFHFAELVARVRALLKRSAADPATLVGDVVLDPVTHAMRRGDAEVSLTPTEFRVLAALFAQPDAVVRRRELVAAAWPDGAIVHDNTLDQYVARLRRKLREVGSEVAVETAHGVGYRLR
jgi:two-component system, OmpR family, response regulator